MEEWTREVGAGTNSPFARGGGTRLACYHAAAKLDG